MKLAARAASVEDGMAFLEEADPFRLLVRQALLQAREEQRHDDQREQAAAIIRALSDALDN